MYGNQTTTRNQNPPRTCTQESGPVRVGIVLDTILRRYGIDNDRETNAGDNGKIQAAEDCAA